MSNIIAHLTAEIRRRWQTVRASGDAGYTTETVLITALLVTLAIVVIGIILVKVTGKANSIDLG